MPLKFKLAEGPVRVKWPVKVEVPVDGGKVEKHTFTAVFIAEPISDQRERWEKMRSLREDGDQLAALRAEDEMLRAVFVGWGNDVQDEDGQALAYTEDARDQMLDVKYMRVAILNAYQAFTEGKRAKN